jgi:hypothetical protein
LKNPCVSIPPRRPKSAAPTSLVHRKAGPHPFPSPPSLPGRPCASVGQPVRDRCLSRAHLSGSPTPNSLPCSAPVHRRRQFCRCTTPGRSPSCLHRRNTSRCCTVPSPRSPMCRVALLRLRALYRGRCLTSSSP